MKVILTCFFASQVGKAPQTSKKTSGKLGTSNKKTQAPPQTSEASEASKAPQAMKATQESKTPEARKAPQESKVP